MCQRKYRTWLAVTVIGAWWPGACRWWRRNGGLAWCKALPATRYLTRSPTIITAITNVYQPHAKGNNPGRHPFTKYFEELRIGDQIITSKRTITSYDINKFADLSGDHFYAHNTSTDFTGTMFEQQVAHGYFIMSIAAGLFVGGYNKNPVLLNYGMDELRFIKPVYPGSEIYIRFTCKEKLPNDIRIVEKKE